MLLKRACLEHNSLDSPLSTVTVYEAGIRPGDDGHPQHVRVEVEAWAVDHHHLHIQNHDPCMYQTSQ